MVLSSLIVKSEKGQKEIENNNSNAPWKTYASHICHDPDLYNNTNYIDSEDVIGFRANRDASNNILYIENKKTDTIISVTEDRKIKMDGITEFSNNTIFNGIINCNNLLDVTTISNEILRTQRIYPNNDATDVTIEGNLTVNGNFNKSGTQAITTNVANGSITGCTILNSVIGRDASGDQREAGYFTNIDTNNLIINNDVSINNDLIINNNIFLRYIEDASYTYHDLSTLLDISINLFQNFPTTIQIDNIEDSNNNNKFYIGRSNYNFNIEPANIKFIGFYIKNRNFITITSPFVNETINNLYYYIYDLTSNIPINLNISGNFEYISIVTLTRISDSYTINHEFNEIFLYKHDIDLIDKLNTIDDKIINISSFGTSATTINSNFYITGHTNLSRDLTIDGVFTCNSDLSASGTITGTTSITLDSTTITTAELGVLDNVTPGTASASKALVLNATRDISNIRNLTIDGIFTDGNYTFDTNGNVSNLGTINCGAITCGDLSASGTITGTTSITLDSTTITTAELGVLDNVTPGTADPSKALVLNATRDISNIRNLTIDGIFTNGTARLETNGDVSGLGTINCGAITSSGNLKVNNSILGINDNLSLYTSTDSFNSYGFLELAPSLSSLGSSEFCILTGSDNTTEGFERLRILSNGNVGIGTTNPTYKLEVNGDISCGAITSSGNLDINGTIKLDNTTISSIELGVLDNVTPGRADPLKALVLDGNRDVGTIHDLTIDGVFTNGTARLETNGNVSGLGTINCGAITSSGNLKVNNKIHSTNNQLEIYPNTNATDSYSWMEMRTDKLALGAPIVEFYSGSTDVSMGSLAMNILSNGNVGINKTNPTQKLDVNGNIQVANKILGTNNNLLLYTSSTRPNSYGFLEMTPSITSLGSSQFCILTGSDNTSAGSERLRILSNGNVGIGTNNPTKTLEVNGTFSASSDVIIRDGFINSQFGGGHFVLSHKNQSNKSSDYGLFLTNGIGPTVINGPAGSYLAIAQGNGYKMFVYATVINHTVPFSGPSDDRLKWEETPITDGLDVIMALKPVAYWKGEIIDVEPTEEERRWEIGLIAQEVEKIPQLKHCVGYNENTQEPEKSSYTLNYADIHNYHLSATQELYKKMELQETLIQTLLLRIEVLESRT